MKFDPIRKNVFTDSGEFIKQLHCPFRMTWDQLEATTKVSRQCSNCDRQILDSQYFSDEEIQKILSEDPNACLKIDLNQNNIELIKNGK